MTNGITTLSLEKLTYLMFGAKWLNTGQNASKTYRRTSYATYFKQDLMVFALAITIGKNKSKRN